MASEDDFGHFDMEDAPAEDNEQVSVLRPKIVEGDDGRSSANSSSSTPMASGAGAAPHFPVRPGVPPPAPPPVYLRPEDDPLGPTGLPRIPLSMFPTAKIDDRPINNSKYGGKKGDAKGKGHKPGQVATEATAKASAAGNNNGKPVKKGVRFAEPDTPSPPAARGGASSPSSSSSDGDSSSSDESIQNVPINPQLIPGLSVRDKEDDDDDAGGAAVGLAGKLPSRSNSNERTISGGSSAAGSALAAKLKRVASNESFSALSTATQNTAAVSTANMATPSILSHEQLKYRSVQERQGAASILAGMSAQAPNSRPDALDVDDMLKRISVVILQHIQRGEAAVQELGAAAADVGPLAGATIPISLYKIAAGLVPGEGSGVPSVGGGGIGIGIGGGGGSIGASDYEGSSAASSAGGGIGGVNGTGGAPFGFGIEAKLKRFRPIIDISEGAVTADTAVTDGVSLLRSMLVSVCAWGCFNRRQRYLGNGAGAGNQVSTPSGLGGPSGDDSTDDEDGRGSRASTGSNSHHHHHHHGSSGRKRDRAAKAEEALLLEAEKKRLSLEARMRAYRCWNGSICCAPCRWLSNDGLDDGSFGPPVPSYHNHNSHHRYGNGNGDGGYDSADDEDGRSDDDGEGGDGSASDEEDDWEDGQDNHGGSYLDRDRFGNDGDVDGAAGLVVGAASPRTAFFSSEAPPDSPSFRFRIGGASEVAAGGFALGPQKDAGGGAGSKGMIPLRIASPGQGEGSVTSAQGYGNGDGHASSSSNKASSASAAPMGPRPEALYDAEVDEDVFHESRYLRPQFQLLHVRTCSVSSPLTVDARPHLTRMRYVFPMPTSQAIYNFMKRLFTVAKLTAESSIVSLVYIERLLEGGKVFLRAHNWRPIVICGLLLASKVWDDLNSWSVEFAAIYPQFTVHSINSMERAFVSKIAFNLYISGSVYARYYFALRSLNEQRSFRQRYMNVVAAGAGVGRMVGAGAGPNGAHGGGVGLGRAAPVQIVKKIEEKTKDLKTSLYSRSL